MGTTATRGGAALVALALAITGCGGGDEASGGDDATDAATTADAPSDDAPSDDGDGGDTTTLTVEDFTFRIASTTVPVGATVTWENLDGAGHTVTAGTPDAPSELFDVELPGDGTASVVVEEEGTVPYFCRIHPSMTAELVVEPA